jgi:hypothetical protein
MTSTLSLSLIVVGRVLLRANDSTIENHTPLSILAVSSDDVCVFFVLSTRTSMATPS